MRGTHVVDVAPVPLSVGRRSSQVVADYLALTKPRLNSLVVVTSAGGNYLGASRPQTLLPMAADAGGTALRGGSLFAIVFLWQIPHFMAIVWLYRDDYARAGFPMLPVVEPEGRRTGRQAVLYAAALVPISVVPSVVGLTGAAYFWTALVLG